MLCYLCNSMLERDYEKFRGGANKPTSERVHVTLSPKGVIAINKNCFALIGKPPAVYLYYSREKDNIAIEPVTSPRLPESFPVRQKKDTGWIIQASPFCRHFGIRVDTTTKFISPEIRDGKLLLKLSETVSVKRLAPYRKKK